MQKMVFGELMDSRIPGDFITRNQPGTQQIKIQVSVVGVQRVTVGSDDLRQMCQRGTHQIVSSEFFLAIQETSQELTG